MLNIVKLTQAEAEGPGQVLLPTQAAAAVASLGQQMNQSLSLIYLLVNDCLVRNIVQETTPLGCWSKVQVL